MRDIIHRHPHNNEDEQKRHEYSELEKQILYTHSALFIEVDHLNDVCTYLLQGHRNVIIRTSEMCYNITRLHQLGPTRIKASSTTGYCDYSIDTQSLRMAEGDLPIQSPDDIPIEFVAYREHPANNDIGGVSDKTDRLDALQEELLIAAGVIEQTTQTRDIIEIIGRTAVA